MHTKNKDTRRLKTNGIVVTRDERNELYPGIWLHGWKFQCKLPDPETGKQRTRPVPDEHQGSWKKAHDWFKHESTKDENERLVDSRETFRSYSVRAIDTRLTGAASSKKAYHKRLRTWPEPIHSMRIKEIDNLVILKKVLQPMKDAGLAGSTIHGVMHLLRTIFDLAVADRILASNPMDGIAKADKVSRKTQVKHKMLDERQARLYIGGMLPHYRPLAALWYYAGLRLGESLGLEWQHIDWERGKILIRQQRDADDALSSKLKSEASLREVTLSAALLFFLTELRAEAQGGPVANITLNEELLFPGLNHRAVQGYMLGYGRKLSYLSKDNTKLHLTPHSFRHMWVSGLIMDGIPATQVATEAGHTPASLWEHYAHEIRQAEGRDAIREALDKRHAA